MNLIYDLIINIIDYLIIFKYFKSFSEKRTMKKKYCTILFCGCIILISVVNQFHNPNVNLILCILMIYLYSCSFSYSISYHIILPVLYIGFGIVAELIGFFVLNFLKYNTLISLQHCFSQFRITFLAQVFGWNIKRCHATAFTLFK